MFQERIHREIIKLLIITTAFSLTSVININVIIPSYIAQLGGTILTVGLVYSVMSITRVTSGIMSGVIRDKYGGKIAILLSLLASIISFLILSISNNMKVLIFGLLVLSFSRGFEIPALFSTTATIASEVSLTATLFGLVLTIRFLPVSISPMITGLIADKFGIQITFMIGALFSLVSFFIALKIDFKEEIKGEIHWKILLRKEFLILFISTFFLFISVTSLTPLISYWTVEVLGFDYTTLGLILTMRNLITIFSRIYSGFLADKLGELNTLIFVGILRFISLILFPFTTDPLMITLLMILHGSLVAAPPRSAYISRLFSKEDYGKAFGTLSIAQNMGWIIGPLLVGFVAEFYGYFMAFATLALTILAYTMFILILKLITKA